MKEEIGLMGLIALAGIGMFTDHILEISVPCVVALVAYIGGNHNGERRNQRLTPPL